MHCAHLCSSFLTVIKFALEIFIHYFQSLVRNYLISLYIFFITAMKQIVASFANAAFPDS